MRVLMNIDTDKDEC